MRVLGLLVHVKVGMLCRVIALFVVVVMHIVVPVPVLMHQVFMPVEMLVVLGNGKV